MLHQERRTHRIRPGVAVRFIGESIDRTTRHYLDGVVENCGLGGMFISTDHPFPKGTLITMDFRIASESKALTPVRARGIVRWVQRRAGDRGMGIEFMEFETLSARNSINGWTLVSCHGCNVVTMPVIPAEAGIQKHQSSQKYWIPALAGMTLVVYCLP